MNEARTINADVTMSGAVGVLLAGRYRVIRQLGQGGMGFVWLAEDTKLDGRKVAIKMLPSILVSNKRAYAQVKQEALVSLKLTHPNIVAVRAFEEEDGSPFLVMDYVEGQTLDDYLAEKGKLTEEEAIRLLKPIAAALDYAHAQGVVHRDVKPGNVMIDGAGHPYVLDFGIAREVQETMTRVTGKLSSGTLMYMSPEQLHGAAPKPAQDVYSFAAMAYECLAGHTPFSRGQIEYQIEHDTPAPLGEHIAICSQVMVGLAKSPEARPPTCAAVLEKGAKSQGADGGTSTGKTRIAVVLLGVLALGALVGVGCWWWQGRARAEWHRNEILAAERVEAARVAADRENENRIAEDENQKAEVKETCVAEKNEMMIQTLCGRWFCSTTLSGGNWTSAMKYEYDFSKDGSYTSTLIGEVMIGKGGKTTVKERGSWLLKGDRLTLRAVCFSVNDAPFKSGATAKKIYNYSLIWNGSEIFELRQAEAMRQFDDGSVKTYQYDVQGREISHTKNKTGESFHVETAKLFRKVFN